jgi:hypothetical protein
MGINEIDHTVHPYTIGREDCKVFPRSFKTLAEAEAYLAEQDKGALERGEFYLDGPEQDKPAARNASGNRPTAAVAFPRASPVDAGIMYSDSAPIAVPCPVKLASRPSNLYITVHYA